MISDQLRQSHESYMPNRQYDREKLQYDTRRFLESGGQIQHIEFGMTAKDKDGRTAAGHAWVHGRSVEEVTRRAKRAQFGR